MTSQPPVLPSDEALLLEEARDDEVEEAPAVADALADARLVAPAACIRCVSAAADAFSPAAAKGAVPAGCDARKPATAARTETAEIS
jgi:hypothetical protein